jgi:hypothetical protein
MTRSDVALLHREVFVRDREVIDQFEEGTVLHDLIDSGTEVTEAVKSIGEYEGEFMSLMHRIAPPPMPSVGFSEGDEHARAGKSTYRKGKFLLTQQNATLGITGLAKLTTRGGVSSVDDILSLEADAIITAARKRVSEKMHKDGSGLIDTMGSGNTWNDTTKLLTVPDASLFKDWQEIICRNKTAGGLRTGTDGPTTPTTGAKPTPMLITARDESAETLAITTHTGAAFVNTDLDAYELLGIYEYDSQGKDLWGLENICGNANPGAAGFDPADPTTLLTTEQLLTAGLFGGIDRSVGANSDWNAEVWTATALGGTTTPSAARHVKPLLNRIHKKTGGNHGWLLGVTGMDVWDSLSDELERSQRTNFTVRLKAGGYQAIVIGDLYIVADTDADFTKLMVFEPESLFSVVAEPWHIDTTTGTWNRELGDLSRGKNEFMAYWMSSRQLLAGRCRAAGQITGFNTAI